MNDNVIQSLDPQAPPRVATGRPADMVAALLAAAGTILSVIGAIWFFAGFAENDTRPEHLVSVLALTLGLFSLAIAPFAIVAEFARRAYQGKGRISHYLWTILLMLPWVILGTLSLTQTPLPVWVGVIAIILATLLLLWALVSFGLDMFRRNTFSSSKIDVQAD